MKVISNIIFSFVVENKEIISFKEHSSLELASRYVNFPVNTGCNYNITTNNGGDCHTNATWVVNFKSVIPPPPSSIDRLDVIVYDVLRMVLRESKISKLLDHETL